MKFQIKSRDGKSEITLNCVESMATQGQQTSFSFTCTLVNHSSKSTLENIWLDEGDIQDILDGLDLVIKNKNKIFDSFPSYSDLIIKIEASDSQGHYRIDFLLEDKPNESKFIGNFEVDLIDIEGFSSYFKSIISK